jgi:protein-L-isoaspartate(D-aspartate) O-methyltransferase
MTGRPPSGPPRAPGTARFPATLQPTGGAPAAPPARTQLVRPQRPLQQAADDAARRRAPSGLGLDSAAVRERMVQRLRAGGVRCEPVLQAFARVERHRFVDSALAGQAYEDTSLPIGLAQTISKPSVVARMLALLFEGAGAAQRGHLGRVLEIGTGCGYQAALLAQLARTVVSIERLRPLHDKARANLAALDATPGALPADLRLLHGDGRLGHAPRAPYDAIVAAAGGEELPASWLDQLAVGGRLVAPMFDAARGGQGLLVVDRAAEGPDGLVRHWLDAVHFVPLKSGIE